MDDPNDAGNRLLKLEQEVADLRRRLDRLEGSTEPEAVPLPSAESVGPSVPQVIDPVAITDEPPDLAGKLPQPPPAERVAPACPPEVEPAVASGPAPPPPVPPAPSPILTLLKAMHLRPPPEGSGEVQLGAWWTTRIGALLAVIGIVFFGVYISINTPPWVKLTELALVSVAIALAGMWFEKRLPKFGNVVLASGLALIYFTALAAYAVPAVKVTDNIAVSVVLQVAAIALVFSVAINRRSATTATMATLLGFVSTFLSIAEGFDDLAIFGALGLTAVAVILRRWKGWALPLAVAAVLVHVIYVAVAATIWESGFGQRDAVFAFSILGTGFGLVLLSAVLEGPGEGGLMSRAQRWIQSLNAPLAALAGFAAALIILPDESISWYFFGAGAVALGAAFWMWRTAPADTLFSMFAVKAAALIGLGVCTEWGSRTRWVVLAIEAFVLLAAAKRTRKPVLFLAAVAAWIVSLGFFLDDVGRLQRHMVSWDGLVTALYVVGGPLLVAWVVKFLPKEYLGPPRLAKIACAIAAAAPVVRASGLVFEEAWGPLALLAVSLILITFHRLVRSAIPLAAAALAMIAAHLSVYAFNELGYGKVWLWAGAGMVGLVTGAIGWTCSEIEAPRREGWTETWRLWGTLLIAAALTVITAGICQTVPVHIAAGVSALIAAGVAWQGVIARRTALVGAGVLSLVSSVLLARMYLSVHTNAAGSEIGHWLAATGSLLAFCALIQPGATREALERNRWFREATMLAAAVCVLLSWSAVHNTLGSIAATWAGLGIAMIYVTLGFIRRAGAGLAAGSILLLLMMYRLTTTSGWPPQEAHWLALSGAMAIGIAFVAIPAVAVRYCPWIENRWHFAWKVVHATFGTVFILHIAVLDGAPWSPLASVIWATGGIGVFFLGLFFRSRPHRIVGLLALAGCIGRVFLVDINSTLYRIAAFVVLGAVLLWVGFSYQRFRHLIEDDEIDDSKEKESPGAEPPS